MSAVRKTVTVVFCDLVGSTALGDEADPELLQELMQRYHAELRRILEHHGGTVEKFVGDAAMAVFGIPQTHEDDALRACRAAVEMREAVKGLDLEVRIGINTGEVVAGAGETLVTGDAVNVAARLEQAAWTAEILLGAGTERLVRDAVRAEPVEPLELKGKTEPVAAYRLLEVLADAPAFTGRIDAPFVGREAELEALERALAAAVEQRTPHLATVAGPPGIGKSRLVRELVQRADARVVVGRCLSYGEGITYWPLQEIARQLGDLDSVLDDELARARVAAALGAGTASSEEVAWGFRKLFEALAAERPLIVVVDDIHWAEPTLLDLIEYLATFAQDAALLLLCTARADLFDVRPAWATPKANAHLVTLAPLAEDETERLVEELHDVSDETKQRIVEAAEGNPLFVEQLVAMQADNGAGELEIPPTIQALLAARIDRLETPERAVVERASVEGRMFHRGAVQELVPDDVRPDVGGHLMTLVRKELVRPDRSQLPGDDGFRFGHILIRDAAYDSIPKRLRAELHERFAGWLEQRLGEAAPDEILGYHLDQAYRYAVELGRSDDDLGWRAAERLARAGRAATARGDVRAATRQLSRAVELLPADDAVRRRLLVDLADVCASAGDTDRTGELLDEAARLAGDAGDAHVEWLVRLMNAARRLKREPEGGAEAAFAEAQAAIEWANTAVDHEVLARAWLLTAEGHLMRAQFTEQGRAIEAALEHVRRSNNRALELEIIGRSAPSIVFGPLPVDEGLRWVDEMVERLGDAAPVQLFAAHVRGHLWARRGEFEAARTAIDEWRSQFRELGQEAMYASFAVCAWDVRSLAEDWDTTAETLEEAYEILERMGEKGFRSTVAAYLGDVYYRKGRLADAERFSRISEELGASDDVVTQASWRALRGKVRASQGDLQSAVPLANEAVAIASRSDQPDFRAGILLDQAEILRAAGRKEDARRALEEAVDLYERKGNLVGAERARALLR